MAGATLTGLAFGGEFSVRLAVAALVGAALAAARLLAGRSVSKQGVPVADVACAAAVLALGFRLPLTGDDLFDAVATIAYVVAVTRAFASPQPTPNLGFVVALAVTAVTFAVADLGGQEDLSRLAAALIGAGVGLLVWVRRSRSPVGRAGRTFIGFVVAVGALALKPVVAAPGSALIPLLLLALPVLDSAVAVYWGRARGEQGEARERHGLFQLLHARLGPRRFAVAVGASQAVLGAVALFAGRGVLSTGWALGAGLAVLVWLCVRAGAPPPPTTRLRRRKPGGRTRGRRPARMDRATSASGLGLGFGGAHAPTVSSRPAATLVGLPLLDAPPLRAESLAEEEVVVRPRLWRPLLVLGAVALGLSLPAAGAMLQARRPAQAGAERAETAIALARQGDAEGAAEAFRQAGAHFSEAERRLSTPLVSLSRAVPFVSSNLLAARTLVDVGSDAARSGDELMAVFAPGRLRVESGSVPLDELRKAAPVVTDAAKVLREDLERVDDAGESFLVPPLRRGIEQFQSVAGRMVEDTGRAAEAVQLVPAILGGDHPRRYFFGVQNNAELRGTGGFMGSFGELVAEDGRIRLERSSRIQELSTPRGPDGRPGFFVPEEVQRRYGTWGIDWNHVNMSPDFPTVARIIADLYPTAGGRPVDGLILLDAWGLAALLELTGPVTVPDWPEPIGAANAVSVVTHEFDLRGDDSIRRAAFVTNLAVATWEAFARSDLGNLSQIGRTLGQAARGRHLQVFFVNPSEQRLAGLLGVDGSVPDLTRDSLMVVNNNGAGTKVDHFLTRRLRYELRLDPDGSATRVSGRIEMSFTNAAPSSGLPSGTIGPQDTRYAAGENATILSVLTPLAVRGSSLDGEPVEVLTERELGRLAHSHFLRLPSQQSRTLTLDVAGAVPLDGEGWYLLDLIRQPVPNPDEVEVVIEVGQGWEIEGANGLECSSSTRCASQRTLDADATFGVRVHPVGLAGLWDRLRSGL